MGKNYHAMKQYTEAERYFIKSSHIVPNRIYPYYLMALMYMDTGETEKAKTAAHIVLTKEPKVQSTAVKEMRKEAKKILNNNYDDKSKNK
jgi:tetratricopeptide (TPR) repeat protein